MILDETRRRRTGPAFINPRSFFTGGKNGFWYDNDPSTWFEDSAMTIPATFGNPIGAWKDKSGNAIDALQSTSGARPTFGRMPYGGVRNQLTYTEDLTRAAWTKNFITVIPNYAIAPDGSMSADLIYPDSSGLITTRFISQQKISGSAVYVGSVSLVQAGKTVAAFYGASGAVIAGYVDLITGVASNITVGYSFNITAQMNGFWLVEITSPATSDPYILFGAVDVAGLPAVTASGTDGICVWGAQLEVASKSSYQKVVAGWDVTESGVASVPCPWFDGVDDCLDFTSTGGAGLARNVGRFIVAATANFTANIGGDRAIIYLSVSGSTATRSCLAGTSGALLLAGGRRLDANSFAGAYVAQETFSNTIATGSLVYSGAELYLRKNGALASSDLTFQTAGNTSDTASLSCFLGTTGGAGYFGGFLPSVFAIADTALSDAQLLQLETYMAQQIGVTGL